MQLTLAIDPPALAVRPAKEVLLEIMRRKGPCRGVAIVCEPDLPANAYETFYEMVKEGLLVVVDQVRIKGVVPTESVEDIYAAADGA